MKKLYTLSIVLLTAFSMKAQTDVYLKINHQLDNNAFAYNQTATTNSIVGGGTQYQLTRLEYYMAEFVLTHDNGQTSSVPNKWLLIDPSQPTNEFLGSFNITNLQSISFGIGVEAAVNHNDPSLYASSHPLAPKSPSMHWGWTAGYRFVALEGNTGANFNQIFQIHALGDRNYATQTISTTGYFQNGDLIIEIDADYNEALNFITVNSNLLYHGEFNEAATLLSNFQSSVFSQTIVGLDEHQKGSTPFSISPNPSSHQVLIDIDPSYKNLSYSVVDLTGRELASGMFLNKNKPVLSIEQKGVFLIKLYEQGDYIGSRKVIIQ